MPVATRAMLGYLGFDQGVVVLHRDQAPAELVFDNFDDTSRAGIQNYVSVTHRYNPMLPWRGGRLGAIRARDFCRDPASIDQRLASFLVPAPEEELGFRTVGWPRLQEEVGLYLPACGGVVELSVYRELRRRTRVAAHKLKALEALHLPIAAAFETHARLTRPPMEDSPEGPDGLALTQREAEVAELLRLGCGSEAIALRLGISRWTVKDHRKHIFRKLGVSTLAEFFARGTAH